MVFDRNSIFNFPRTLSSPFFNDDQDKSLRKILGYFKKNVVDPVTAKVPVYFFEDKSDLVNYPPTSPFTSSGSPGTVQLGGTDGDPNTITSSPNCLVSASEGASLLGANRAAVVGSSSATASNVTGGIVTGDFATAVNDNAVTVGGGVGLHPGGGTEFNSVVSQTREFTAPLIVLGSAGEDYLSLGTYSLPRLSLALIEVTAVLGCRVTGDTSFRDITGVIYNNLLVSKGESSVNVIDEFAPNPGYLDSNISTAAVSYEIFTDSITGRDELSIKLINPTYAPLTAGFWNVRVKITEMAYPSSSTGKFNFS